MFSLMEPSKELPNVTMLKYPCYVSPILPSERMLYIPSKDNLGLFNLKGEPLNLPYFELKNINDYVLDCQIYNDRLTISDAIPYNNWRKKTCWLTYEERLSRLRSLLNDNIANYNKYIEIPNHLAKDSLDLIETYKWYLTSGIKGVNIRSSDGYYVFGECLENGEFCQLRSIKGE